jgi:hypothetical protein
MPISRGAGLIHFSWRGSGLRTGRTKIQPRNPLMFRRADFCGGSDGGLTRANVWRSGRVLILVDDDSISRRRPVEICQSSGGRYRCLAQNEANCPITCPQPCALDRYLHRLARACRGIEQIGAKHLRKGDY